ncbi:MAG: hypothetical protein M3R59_01925 [Verrucomicrobiota bacterium]|nr:hypothetical protein [Verrucomicrobiota bacterium]
MPSAPKKETSRIAVLPQATTPAVKMTKTQPLITITGTPQPPPAAAVKVVVPALAMPSMIDSIPLPLCWALVAVSAAILLIEIWTYVS